MEGIKQNIFSNQSAISGLQETLEEQYGIAVVQEVPIYLKTLQLSICELIMTEFSIFSLYSNLYLGPLVFSGNNDMLIVSDYLHIQHT